MASLAHRARLFLVASLVLALGCWLGLFGWRTTNYQSQQVRLYNQALSQYKAAVNALNPNNYNYASQADPETMLLQAEHTFDASVTAYEQGSHGDFVQRALYGTPSTELAALAYFHKAMLIVMDAQAEQNSQLITDAITALKDSLKLNPGGPYQGVSTATAARMNAEALTAKYDLELLQHKQPGKSGKKPGKQAYQGAPNSNNNQQPGSTQGNGGNTGI